MARHVFIHPGADAGEIGAYRSETAGQGFDKNQGKAFIKGGKDKQIRLVHLPGQFCLGQSSRKIYRTGTATALVCQLSDFLKFLLISPAACQGKSQPLCQIRRQKTERPEQAFYALFFGKLSGKYQADRA